jgi:DNA-binding GntR family transcriptional regulator
MTILTTGSALAERLRADIDAGAWAPGAPLRQEELADRYGVSRIPVREALQLLQSQGLVVVSPNRGAYVTALDADEVEEIFELRLMIETHLLSQAIPRHNHKSTARLEAIQKELEVEDSRAGWLEGDRSFHEALYEPAGRPRALELALTLRGQVARYAMAHVGPGTRRLEWKREHRQLIAGVRSRDVAASVAALTAHIRETRAAVLQRVQPG